MKSDGKTGSERARATHTERAAAVAAIDAMIAKRPLKPPPYNFKQQSISAATLALRADKRHNLI